MPVMKSQRSFRLTSLKGHILQVEANVPINVPPKLEANALAAGMVPAPEFPVSRTETADDKNDPAKPTEVEPVPEPEEDALEQALLRIIARGDEADFKADGTPKVNKVNAELPIEADRATATEVADAFEALQENMDLAE